MKHKKQIVIAASAVVLIILIIVIRNSFTNHEYPYVRVQKGIFESTIETIGELYATSSTDIEIPAAARNEAVNVRQFKIIDIIQEGSIVKKGDWVASLDPTETEEFRRQTQDNLDNYYNNLQNARLDSNLTLTDSRSEIIKANDNLADKIIKVEQSHFESKAIQRQAMIEKETAERQLQRSKRNLEKRRLKFTTQIRRTEATVRKLEQERDLYNQLISELKIMAPSNGMVVYSKGWDGNKIKTGSYVSRWDPIIVSLPDLSSLVSETYIREVDFAKIKKQMKVRIKIDAFPNKEFDGEVIDIANVGQTIPGEQQTGFKALIRAHKTNELLLPSMTTTNAIILQTWPQALIIPRKALFNQDNKNIVYRQSFWGIEAIEVIIEKENDQLIMIRPQGIKANDKLLTEIPEL